MSLEPVHYIWFAWGYCLAFLTMLLNKSQKIWIHFELKWNKTWGKKNQTKKPKSRLWNCWIFSFQTWNQLFIRLNYFKNPKNIATKMFLFLFNILIFFSDRNAIAAYTYTTSAVLIINILLSPQFPYSNIILWNITRNNGFRSISLGDLMYCST